MATQYAKSVLNYIGNKYKLLPQLMRIFPPNGEIDKFVDLFCGGLDVAQNMIGRANKVYANDINSYVMGILREFQERPIEEILAFVDMRTKEFNLTRTNKEGYLRYRELYNAGGSYATPLDLFTLARFSFNNNMRFNGKGEFNSAFGMNRSDFNATQRANAVKLHTNLRRIELSCGSFADFDLAQLGPHDFIYADPPYLVSDSYYNVGAKEAAQRWEQEDDLRLFAYLDDANKRGIRWAMSNFTHNRGVENEKLVEWIESNYWTVHDINSDYHNCVYCKNKEDIPAVEVVITNY